MKSLIRNGLVMALFAFNLAFALPVVTSAQGFTVGDSLGLIGNADGSSGGGFQPGESLGLIGTDTNLGYIGNYPTPVTPTPERASATYAPQEWASATYAPRETATATYAPTTGTTAYDVYDVYGVSSPSYGYSSSPYYYPTSSYYPIQTASYYPYQTPSNLFAPTTVSSPTSTYAPTTVSSPTSTYAPTDIYSPTSTYAPTNTSTYAPTDTSIYSPTNTSTYAPSTYSSSIYSPTSNPTSIYSPSSIYAPSDSHNSVGGTTVSSYTGPVTVSVVSNTTSAAPQYPVQYGGGVYFGGASYVSPSYFNTPVYYAPSVVQAPTCSITASASPAYLNYGSRAVTLTWTSSFANSGYITPLVGTVAPSGSTTVFPNANTLYTLTVSGNGGTSSCQTYAGAGYAAPIAAAAAPYVALTQIPYTGFDFGPFGNAMYWILLALFAVAISYLVLYFRGGAFALVSGMVRGTAKAPVTAQKEETVSAPAVEASKPVSVARNFGGTKDAMLSVGETEGGIGPRIVVLRA